MSGWTLYTAVQKVYVKSGKYDDYGPDKSFFDDDGATDPKQKQRFIRAVRSELSGWAYEPDPDEVSDEKIMEAVWVCD